MKIMLPPIGGQARREALPLEGRVAAKRQGGVQADGCSIFFGPRTAEATPSGASRHLPLEGGEKPAP
jgi:hypothetical protein